MKKVENNSGVGIPLFISLWYLTGVPVLANKNQCKEQSPYTWSANPARILRWKIKGLEKKGSMLGYNSLQLFFKACVLVCKLFSLPVNRAQNMLKEILVQQAKLFQFYFANSSQSKDIFPLAWISKMFL